ncbi:MAG: ABC transporter permease [Armatimonadetes bacterium]|nr:ABC transporter permease [Armatimonadota bacterium]
MNLSEIFNFSLIYSALRLSIPLILASLGGIFSELSGVVNIALEGIMLLGAFFGMLGSYYFNPLAGIILAVIIGSLTALMHALLSIKYRTDQIVSGIAINIFAVGLTNFLLFLLFKQSGHSPEVKGFSWIIYAVLAFILVILGHFILFYTPLGLRIRAVGEHPRACDTLGINIYKIRYLCVIISGILAAFSGAYLSLGHLSSFTREMSAGRGFIAIAAMIFGKWKPIGALYASLFFGFADALQLRLMGKGMIPPEFLNSLPYIFTMIVLAGVIGKAHPPASIGIPYNPEEGE